MLSMRSSPAGWQKSLSVRPSSRMWLMNYFAHLRATLRYLYSPVLIALSVKTYSAQAWPRLQLEPSQ